MVKNLTSVSGDKDQVNMHQENTMLPRRISVSLFIDQSIIWPVKRLQAFKFQLRPGGQQEREMRRFAGACRFVFNRALALQNENHEAGNKYIPYGKMASWLVEWKNATETQWLKDSPSQPLQQSLKDPERAYKNFFRLRHHAQTVCYLSRL